MALKEIPSLHTVEISTRLIDVQKKLCLDKTILPQDNELTEKGLEVTENHSSQCLQ